MAPSLASVDGQILPLEEACIPITDASVRVGWSVFETLVADQGQIDRLDAHLDRLAASAHAACVALPTRDVLAAQIGALAHAHGAQARMRITLTGSGRCLITAEDVDPSRWGQSVRAITGPHANEPFLGGGVKHGSRAPWVVAVARSGVDEVLLVDSEGRFTEGTTSGILVVIAGEVWTAAHDGRVLASTTVNALLARAESLGITVHRQGARPADGFDGLYIASATRGLAPVIELDGVALTGWEPVGRRLAGA